MKNTYLGSQGACTACKLKRLIYFCRPYICVGYADGAVELHQFVEHKLFLRLDFRDFYKVVIPPKEDSVKGDTEITKPQLSVTCVKYSPSGYYKF